MAFGWEYPMLFPIPQGIPFLPIHIGMGRGRMPLWGWVCAVGEGVGWTEEAWGSQRLGFLLSLQSSTKGKHFRSSLRTGLVSGG